MSPPDAVMEDAAPVLSLEEVEEAKESGIRKPQSRTPKPQPPIPAPVPTCEGTFCLGTARVMQLKRAASLPDFEEAKALLAQVEQALPPRR